MPAISFFYGIRIRMFFDDKHAPHFHAKYGEFMALIAIADTRVLGGRLPNHAYRLVSEWTELHRAELMANWERARLQQDLEWIDGLD